MPDYTRPTIWVDNGDLAEHADEAWSCLVQWSDWLTDPRVLVKDGILARVTDRALEPYDRYSLREDSSRSARYAKLTASGGITNVYPPIEIMDSLIRRDPAEYRGAPRVTHVIDVPVVASDGTLVVEEGIHDSGLYYKPSLDLDGVDWFKAETVDDVVDARDLLLEDFLGDFDFKNQGSRANALGLLLLPFVRHLIGANPTPLHVVKAVQAGSGKSYLAQACLIPGSGLVGMAPEPNDDDELRKLITSSLLSGRAAIVFDNVNSSMASGTLASALTSRVWQDRVLGQSKEVSLPIRCIWVSTGNQWDAAHELVDRVCPIDLLPPGDEEVARRRGPSAFRHPDLHGWALANRPRLVQAALTLVHHWLEGDARVDASGNLVRITQGDEGWRQTGSDATLGSFERWAEVIGGILRAADVRGFLSNLDESRVEMDYEEQETRDFLEVVKTTFPFGVSSSDLATACQFGGTLFDQLPSDINGRRLVPSLRAWLRKHNNQRHGNLKLEGTGPQSQARVWAVRETDS